MGVGGQFRVLLRVELVPERAGEFEQAWYDIGAVVTRHPANLGQWLARSSTEEHVYYIVSDWIDEPRFREFEKSQDHLEHRKALHPFRTGGSMATMQVVYDLRPEHAVGAPA